MAPPQTNGAGAWIPLRDDYFEAPLLSQKETTYLVRKACEAAQEVVERARSTGGPIQWRHVEKYNDVQLYAGFARGTYSAEATTMCGVTSVPGSLKEIASLFDLSTTRAMKDFSRAHRELFFDAVVLHTLHPRSREHPLHQVTAKWIATRSPKGLDDRDFCYLECQDKFTDSTGRKGWVLCLHSIKLPGCDDLTREFGFVRGSFYHSGIVAVEADRPGFVDIIHILQMNLKQNTVMPPAYLRERVAWIGKIKTILREKRLNEQRYLSDLELVPKKYRSRCNVCQDSFSLLLLRKMNCRKCGEVVCGACSKDFDVTNAKFLETVKLRICMHCYQLITAGQMLGRILDEPRASTSLSLLGYYDDTQRASIITDPLPGNMNGVGPGHGNRGPSRDRPTKIILHSMAQRRADRRGRRPMGHGAPPPGYGPPPPPMGDGRRTYALPRPSSNGYGYGYDPTQDSRSLFDKPRGTGLSTGGPPLAPATPASLFDRQTPRAKIDDFDGKSPTTNMPLTGPSPRSSQDFDNNAVVPNAPLRNSRVRGDSDSSSSSTDSIDIDSYDVGKAIAAPLRPELTIAEDRSYPNAPTVLQQRAEEDDEDTEGSIGSGDDEPNYQPKERAPKSRPAPTYYEDEEEEKKTDEFGGTPALPPPSPSNYTGMENALLASARDDSDLPFQRRNFNVSDFSIDTAGCDISYLDTQMREFHGQPFYMREEATTDSDPRETIDYANANSPRASVDNQSEAASVAPSSAPSLPRSVTSPQKVMTSPQKTLNLPPLYGRPKKNEAAAPQPQRGSIAPAVQRESTGSLPSSMSSGDAKAINASFPSSLSSGDAEVVNESLLLAGALSRQAFELGNNTLLSEAPSAHSNEDLTFKPDGNQRASPTAAIVIPEEALAQEKPKEPPQTIPPPVLPSYVPARFQNRHAPGKERLSQEEVLEQKRLSDELLRSDDEKIERLIGRDTLAHVQDVRSSAASNNQENIEDVDFEELLRMSKLEQEEKQRKANFSGVLVRSQTFDPSRASVDTDVAEFHDSSDDSESEEGELLSARRIYSRFESAKRLANVAGVGQNETFQRRFEQIKEHIHMLSDSEDDSDSGEEEAIFSDQRIEPQRK